MGRSGPRCREEHAAASGPGEGPGLSMAPLIPRGPWNRLGEIPIVREPRGKASLFDVKAPPAGACWFRHSRPVAGDCRRPSTERVERMK